MPKALPAGAKRTDLVPVVSSWARLGSMTGGGAAPGAEGTPYDSPYFGPNRPVQPVIAPAQAAMVGVPRVLDYIPGINLWFTPQRDSGISFEQLDDLSRMWDLLRSVMETKKDLVCKREFWFRIQGDEKRKVGDDPRFKELEQVFNRPDGEHYWPEWLRMILEDSYKWDANAIKPGRTYGQAAGMAKGASVFDLLPGNTILRLLDKQGKTPIGKDPDGKYYPGYRQIIKGAPVWDVPAAGQGAVEELLYLVRNPSTSRVYGFSPVEQLIMTINQGIRRELSKLAYYTDGNMPDYLIPTNPNWSPSQIAEFQALWDALFEGDIAARRKGKFVPGGTSQPHEVKEPPLKDTVDEWYARKVCYCFGMSVNALLSQSNRSVAETGDKQSKEEGVDVEVNWVGRVITSLVHLYWGYTDIEFCARDFSETDPLKQAQIDAIDIAHGVASPQSVAKRKGIESDGQEIIMGAGVQPLSRAYEEPEPVPPELAKNAGNSPQDGSGSPKGDGADGEEGGEDPKKGKAKGGAKPEDGKPAPFRKDKGHKVLSVLPRDRKTTRKGQKAMAKGLKAMFAKARPAVVKQALAIYEGQAQRIQLVKGRMQNDVEDPFDVFVEEILEGLTLEEFASFYPVAYQALEDLLADATLQAAEQVLVEENTVIMGLVSEEATLWAETRAAELVGMKLVDGELIVNPNAAWAITDGTRTYLRGAIKQAIEEGWSTDQLAEAISENTAFSDYRAEMVARTEIRRADVQGNLIAYRNSGVVIGLKWLLSVAPCEKCIINEASGKDGIIGIGQSWPYPFPVHPNEECDIAPVVAEDFPSEEAA